MPRPTAVVRARSTALVALLAMLLVGLVPMAAHAAPVPGGTSSSSPVALPISDFDSAFEASNGHVTSGRGSGQYWNNVAWYSVIPTEDVRVFIRATSISPVRWDNTLEVWQNGGAMIAQNDDFYSLDASVTVNLVAGTSYLIGLGGWSSGSRGTATLTFASRVPGPPTGVQATRGDARATVSWAAPADAAGGVTRYTVLCTPEGGDEFVCGSTTGTPPATSTTVTGLDNGASYSIRVTASNVIGESVPSDPTGSIVPKQSSTISITTDPVAPASGRPFDVVATVTTGGLPATSGTVVLAVGGEAGAALPVVDGRAVLSGTTRPVGTFALAADYSGTTVIAEATASASITVAKRSQTVTLEPVGDGLAYGGAAVPLTATASSGLPVDLTAAGACTVSEGTLQLTGVGTCEITASQAGDDQTFPADATQTVEVGKRGQTVALAPLPALVYGQAPVTLVAESSAGLPVTLTAGGACTVDGDALSVIGVGACEVTASQAGDALTSPAASVVRTGTVAKRAQVITLTTLPSMTFGFAPIRITATSDLGLPVTVTATGACLLVDGELTAVGVGECVVQAHADGDDVSLPGSATSSGTVMGVPSQVEAELDRDLGARAAGATVSARGTGLLPGSELVLEVHSTPQVIGSAVVGADGTAVVTGVLPEGLEAGAHELVAVGTALDGSRAEFVLPFTLATDGTITRIQDRVLPVAAPVLASTGSEPGVVGLLAVLWMAVGTGLVVLRRRSMAARSV